MPRPQAMEAAGQRGYTATMRLRFVFLAGAILGGLLGYYAVWSLLIGRVEAGVQAFQAAQRAQGRDFTYASMQRGGFPYRLSLRLDGISLTEPKPAGWRVEAETLVAHQQLWSSQHIVFELFGRQAFIWRDGSGSHTASLVPERGRASLVLDGADRWLRFAADIQGARFGDALQGFEAQRLQVHLRQAGNVPPMQDVALQVNGLTLPASFDGPLGRSVQELNLVGRQTGPWVGNSLEDTLAGWRDAGGVIEFNTVVLNWNAVKLSGDGSLTIDKQFRPLGAMGGKLLGAPAGIDALVAAGKMQPREAAAAKAALVALHKRDPAGTEPYLSLPLTAQDGRLSIANVPLFPLEPLLNTKK
ncbi:MAG: DUF2125 domain-containing protein [Ferrovibrio sp.]|nr:DUF2125 domain-containing protein [Ferrovibrio sp.]